MKTSIGLVLALAAGVAAAADNDVRGQQTHAWVAAQKNPAKTAPARGLPGEAADRVYQRYLQSFTRPIPERFERERTGDAQK